MNTVARRSMMAAAACAAGTAVAVLLPWYDMKAPPPKWEKNVYSTTWNGLQVDFLGWVTLPVACAALAAALVGCWARVDRARHLAMAVVVLLGISAALVTVDILWHGATVQMPPPAPGGYSAGTTWAKAPGIYVTLATCLLGTLAAASALRRGSIGQMKDGGESPRSTVIAGLAAGVAVAAAAASLGVLLPWLELFHPTETAPHEAGRGVAQHAWNGWNGGFRAPVTMVAAGVTLVVALVTVGERQAGRGTRALWAALAALLGMLVSCAVTVLDLVDPPNSPMFLMGGFGVRTSVGPQFTLLAATVGSGCAVLLVRSTSRDRNKSRE